MINNVTVAAGGDGVSCRPPARDCVCSHYKRTFEYKFFFFFFFFFFLGLLSFLKKDDFWTDLMAARKAYVSSPPSECPLSRR